MDVPQHTPLKNDMDQHLQSQRQGWWLRVRRWLGRAQIYIEPRPLGYGVVKQALVQRPEFADREWSHFGVDIDVAQRALAILCDIGAWPNPHFLPEDSLIFVLRSSDIDWGPEQLMERIEDEITHGRRIDEILQCALDQDWTIGRFVKSLVDCVDERRPLAGERDRPA